MNTKLRNFYETSPMKDGILCWYPFEEGVEYEIVIDPEDFSLETLRRFREKLGNHGRLLLAYENPFALRYWNGKLGPDGESAYETIFGGSKLPSKANLSRRLKLAGFEGQKWYYPLTDHWFTREVYSDTYLPNEFFNQRLVMYVEDCHTLRYHERRLYREVALGGAFEFMCGAYLVEARVCANDSPCPVDYAAVTAYRDSSKRFATTVRNDGTTRKIALCPEGMASIKRIYENHRELSKLGVNVIPIEINGNELVMRKIEFPTLWDYWALKYADGLLDVDMMFKQFDRIRDSILKASRCGKCYWELVPANCFYDELRDNIMFFDQEFYWNESDPDIAIARAIYSVKWQIFANQNQADEWLDVLIKRYGLIEKWGALENIVKTDGAIDKNVFNSSCTNPLEEMSVLAEMKIDRKRNIRDRLDMMIAVADQLKESEFIRPAIYGFGVRGKSLKAVFDLMNIYTSCIIDRSAVEIKRVEDIPEKCAPDLIVVSIKNGDDIARDLRTRINVPVKTIEEILND